MTTLSVPDMNCAHCKLAVETALAAVPGVETVVVDLPGRVATIMGNALAPALIAALDQAGYPATRADEGRPNAV
jgi:copper chaperone